MSSVTVNSTRIGGGGVVLYNNQGEMVLVRKMCEEGKPEKRSTDS